LTSLCSKKSLKSSIFLLFLLLHHSFSREAIPLPNHGLWSEKGISAQFSLGKWYPHGCQSLFQWRGKAQYMYSPSFSGLAELQMRGGDIGQNYTYVAHRYALSGQFYQKLADGVFYESIIMALDQSDFSKFRPEGNTEIIEQLPEGCESLGQNRGFTPGLEVGYGHHLWGPIYWNFSSMLDTDFDLKVKSENSLGLAWDVLPLRHSRQDLNEQSNVAAIYLYFDFYLLNQSTRVMHEKFDLLEREYLILTGFGVLF
jgi:hypothetical protein